MFTDATMENSQEPFTEELSNSVAAPTDPESNVSDFVTPKLPGERKSWVIKLPASLLRAGNKVDRDHIII